MSSKLKLKTLIKHNISHADASYYRHKRKFNNSPLTNAQILFANNQLSTNKLFNKQRNKTPVTGYKRQRGKHTYTSKGNSIAVWVWLILFRYSKHQQTNIA